VGQDGGVYEGVGWNNQGSKTDSYNDISLSITFMGTFTGKWRIWVVAILV
jgi:N-acetylmuramoyl-L-alanine amidase